VSAGWPDLRSTSHVENPLALVGAMGWRLVWHEHRWGSWREHTAEIWDGSSLGPPMAFPALGLQVLVLFSRYWGFIVGPCRKWGNCKTNIWELSWRWVSCRAMMNALFLQASCSITLLLFAVSPSVFSWSMLGRGSSLAAAELLTRLAPGVPYPAHTEHIHHR